MLENLLEGLLKADPTHQLNYGGINEARRLLSAFSVPQKALFGNILKNKKDRRLKIGRGITHSIFYRSKE